MAGSNHAILDLGEDDLQFTTNDYKSGGGGGGQQGGGGMTQFPTPTTDRDTSQLIDDQAEGEGGPSDWKTSNFWTFAFYQQFFDIDTVDVKNRVMYSMVPMPGKSFLQYHIRPRPDLYGPFWVCVTLVFSIAISGNMSDYLQKSFQTPDSDHTFAWHYDFHKVSLAAMVVFSYASLLPAGLYGFMWWAGAGQVGSSTISFIELLCLYGYSLTIYIPVSLLWLVQISWWQWICVLLGAGLSGVVLFTPIWPAVRHQAARSAAIVMVVIVSLHILLAVGFMLYFFHVPSGSGGAGVHNVTETVPVKNDNINETGGNGQQEENKALVAEKKVQEQTQSIETSKKDSGGDNKVNEDKGVTKRENEVHNEENSKDNSSNANKVQVDNKKGSIEEKQDNVSESENNVSEKEII